MTRALEIVREELTRVADEAASRGMPRIEISGQLIRPAIAYAEATFGGRELPPGFWKGALAVQLAHEASLVHDDIIDAAPTRRGQPTIAAAHGIAKAVVFGDHLLTAAYRLAAETRSIDFATMFAGAVERTVAGEIAQARSLGKTLTWNEYREIAEGKAGELLGCSLALRASLVEPERIAHHAAVGKQLGLLYQMLDDLLDYCPGTDTGKGALGDFNQKRWTWPLLELGEFSFDEDATAISRRFRAGAMRRCLSRLEAEAAQLRASLTLLVGDDSAVIALVDEWIDKARTAVAREEKAHRAPAAGRTSHALGSRVPAADDVVGYLASNSKSFRFASRLFPPQELKLVADVYAWCRVTDDLVDRPEGGDPVQLLDEWMDLSLRAHEGTPSGIVFLDRVMSDMASRNIPFTYASELAEGMRMDLRGVKYATLPELRTYTYRVASVVGLWLTELSGVRDSRVLARAAALGHAMQLTNILRDVGEDARAGRVYLPDDYMNRHGVTPAMLSLPSGARVSSGYAALIEDLLRVAERDYAIAFKGIPDLPPGFQKPVAVAAHVYRGIHDEIRRRSYDNITQRAVTSFGSKALLATRALWDLRSIAAVGVPRTT
jgi:phytoene/squalene synthetase/geranylgeranyl pyrophosphate synthase